VPPSPVIVFTDHEDIAVARRLVDAGILTSIGPGQIEQTERTYFKLGFAIGAAMGIVLMLLVGCSHPLYPSTAGSHAAPSKGDLGARYVVWSNHPGVGHYITSVLLSNGHPVVERSRLDALFAEQRVTLSHTRDEDVLRVGRLVGATHVIFAEVHGVDPPKYSMIDRPPRQSVTIRSVAVESGEVRWTGLAAYPEPSSNPEQSVIALTAWAIARALCEGTWEEHTANRDGGCRKLAPAQEAKQEKTIWGEMRKMEKR
jgi:hypothetical protein